MGRKKSAKNYRQFYKDYYGVEFGSDMAVHHIDFDRTNNDISNLLLMPKALHAKYHFCVNALGGNGCGIIDGNMKIRIDGYAEYKASMLHHLADAIVEIQEWVNRKNNLDIERFCKSQGRS